MGSDMYFSCTQSTMIVTGLVVSRKKDTLTVSVPDLDRTITITVSDYNSIVRCTRDDIVSCVATETTALEEPQSDNALPSEKFVPNFFSDGPLLISRSVVEKKHVISSMISAVRENGQLRIIPARIIQLYQAIEDKLLTGELPTVSHYLSYKANMHNIGHRDQVIGSITSGTSCVSQPELTYLLRGWYMKNDLRLLECVGISRDEVRECFIRADILYSLYLENPLMVYCVPLEAAVQAARLLEIDVPLYEEAGAALRELASSTTKWANTCMNKSSFIRRNELSADALSQLLERAVTEDKCEEQDVLYLKEMHDIEVFVAAQLKNIFTATLPPVGAKRLKHRDSTLDYDDEQVRAAERALTSNISVITGAAGTGKTTIIKNIIACLRMNDVQFACTSFTGCATARISECCNVDTSDMDLMIVKSDTFKFSHLIIDEFSMTNIKLMYHFLQAFPGPYRLTIIGDVNQLEPIGPGTMLKQMIKSECIPVTTLKTIHRVQTKSGVLDKIIENSKRIAYWEDKPFSFVEGDNFNIKEGADATIMKEIISLHKQGRAATDFTIMSPWLEPLKLINRAVQAQYNWKNKCCSFSKETGWTVLNQGVRNLETDKTIYHLQDRVMIKKNREDPKMFNGQEGIVTNIDTKGVDITIKGAAVIRFPFHSKEGEVNIIDLTLSYACTVHKMQGKQCKLAIYYIGDRYSGHVTRNMTYTAITRAEEEVLLIGTRQNFNKSVNNVPKDKKEFLYWRLRQMLPQDFCAEVDTRMQEEIRERQYQNALEAAAEGDGYSDEGDDYDDWD